MTLHLVPETANAKPCRLDQYWIICNASVCVPHLQNVWVRNGADLGFPVAINAEAELPSYLAVFALSVERVYRELDMRSTEAIDLNVQIVGRGRDLTHWFRMLRFPDPEIWNACT